MDTGEEKCTNTQFSNHLKDIFDTKYKKDLGIITVETIHIRQKYLDRQLVLMTNNKIYFNPHK